MTPSKFVEQLQLEVLLANMLTGLGIPDHQIAVVTEATKIRLVEEISKDFSPTQLDQLASNSRPSELHQEFETWINAKVPFLLSEAFSKHVNNTGEASGFGLKNSRDSPDDT